MFKKIICNFLLSGHTFSRDDEYKKYKFMSHLQITKKVDNLIVDEVKKVEI